MNDQDIIKSAYADTLKELFQVFFDNSITAESPAERQDAEERFKTGVSAARKIQDKAIALLP